jgi:hypothetical protein
MEMALNRMADPVQIAAVVSIIGSFATAASAIIIARQTVWTRRAVMETRSQQTLALKLGLHATEPHAFVTALVERYEIMSDFYSNEGKTSPRDFVEGDDDEALLRVTLKGKIESSDNRPLMLTIHPSNRVSKSAESVMSIPNFDGFRWLNEPSVFRDVSQYRLLAPAESLKFEYRTTLRFRDWRQLYWRSIDDNPELGPTKDQQWQKSVKIPGLRIVIETHFTERVANAWDIQLFQSAVKLITMIPTSKRVWRLATAEHQQLFRLSH